MIKFIFYTFIFYVLMKIFRMFLDPVFDKKENAMPREIKDKMKQTEKPIAGEYIDYEEIK